MNFNKIITEAWHITKASNKLLLFAFLPAFFAVIMFVLEIIWQYGMLSEEMGWIEHGSFFTLLFKTFSFIKVHGALFWLIIFIIALIFFSFVLPPLIQATFINLLRKKSENPNCKISIREGLVKSTDHFFPLFEFNAMMKPFHLMTIGFFVIFIYRYFHGDIFNFIFPIILGYSIFSVFLNLFLSFVPFFICCDEMPLMKALKKSFSLVFINFGTVLWLIALIVIIDLHVVLNAVLVIGIPLLLISLGSYMASAFITGLFYVIAVFLGIILTLFTSYITAIVIVFSTSFWERAFTFLKNKQTELLE